MANLVKKGDKIVKETETWIDLEITAKKGKAVCRQYKTLEAAIDGLREDRCLFHINRAERTDVINGVNRPVSEKALEKKAMNEIIAQDPELKKLIEARMAAIKAQMGK